MQRHRTDFLALFFGLAFLATGAGFIAHQTTGHAFDVTWIAAVALVSIGFIFLGATLLRGARPTEGTMNTGPSDAPVAIGEAAAESNDDD